MKDLRIELAPQSRVSEVDFTNLPFGKIISDHMFEIDFDGKQWVNPRISPVHQLDIHPMNMALHYGQSIFEGMKAARSVDGKPMLFRPELHAKRMNASAVRMCMPEIPEEIFLEAIHALVAIDQAWIPPAKGSAMYIRPFMFATDNMIGVKASDTYKFAIILLPVGPYYPRPIKLLVEHQFVRAVRGGVGEAKTAGNYAAALYPSKLARQKGYDQVLWLDANNLNFVQEVGTMNIFFVFDNEIVTPSTSGAILKGITRASVIDYLRHLGKTVVERDLGIDEVHRRYKAGELIEVFGTGTAALVANIDEILYVDQTMRFDMDKATLSNSIREEINAVRYGTAEDELGWMVPVREPVMTNA